MHVVADRIFPDEPCYGLMETRESGRWIQRVFVVRGGRKAKFETDFGPVSDFPNATEIIYASYGDDSVGQLQELAERDRHSDKWAKRRREMQAESTLIKDILRQEEEMMEVRRNRSHFGPLVSTQRIDFPREAVERERQDARNRRKGT
ncbi:hypothetical protein LCGC14_2208620 [marine sediment metagenome]|uniref:Uncharacterized protein n=1 Tax=marine sediment metagenome TaxID=412755 RepID=A0A0F9E1Y9_9ZZZZ